jgi:protein-disulfide isomerase
MLRLDGRKPAGARRALTLGLAAILQLGIAAGTAHPAAPGQQGGDRTTPPEAGAAAAETAPAAVAGQQFPVQRHSPREGYPSLGPLSARNTLVFFTDYQCPVCPRAAREMERLVADFKGELRVEVHHHPLAMHTNAFDAAAAARAAQRQGKFWEYHEALLNPRRLDRDALLELAAGLGLDSEAFTRDFDDPALRQEVAAEAREAEAVHATATPGFLINGHVEVGWASLAWLEQIVRAHARPGTGPAAPEKP